MNDKYSFIIPAIIFAVAVSVIGGFLAVRSAQLTSVGLTADSAAIGAGAVMGADGLSLPPVAQYSIPVAPSMG